MSYECLKEAIESEFEPPHFHYVLADVWRQLPLWSMTTSTYWSVRPNHHDIVAKSIDAGHGRRCASSPDVAVWRVCDPATGSTLDPPPKQQDCSDREDQAESNHRD